MADWLKHAHGWQTVAKPLKQIFKPLNMWCLFFQLLSNSVHLIEAAKPTKKMRGIKTYSYLSMGQWSPANAVLNYMQTCINFMLNGIIYLFYLFIGQYTLS